MVLYKVIMTVSQRSCGYSLSSQQQMKSLGSYLSSGDLPCFHISGGIPSTPAFPVILQLCNSFTGLCDGWH